MPQHCRHFEHSRRHFLASRPSAWAALALAWLLQQDDALAAPPKPQLERPTFDLKPQPPAAPAAGHGDDLDVHAGRAEPHRPVRSQAGARPSGTCRTSPATSSTTTPPRPAPSCSAARGSSRKHGQCGMELSELLPHLGERRRRHLLIRSMHTGVNNHGQSINALNNGRIARRPPGARVVADLRAWAARARTCRRSSCSPIRRACRCWASTTGRTAGCRRCIKARSSARRSRGF